MFASVNPPIPFVSEWHRKKRRILL